MLKAVPSPSPPVAALAAEPGWRLSGLRLADGTVMLKVEHGVAAVQLRVSDGTGFDPAGGIRLWVDTPAGHAGSAAPAPGCRSVAGGGHRFQKSRRRITDGELLQVLDAKLAGKSLREIAIELHDEEYRGGEMVGGQRAAVAGALAGGYRARAHARRIPGAGSGPGLGTGRTRQDRRRRGREDGLHLLRMQWPVRPPATGSDSTLIRSCLAWHVRRVVGRQGRLVGCHGRGLYDLGICSPRVSQIRFGGTVRDPPVPDFLGWSCGTPASLQTVRSSVAQQCQTGQR